MRISRTLFIGLAAVAVFYCLDSTYAPKSATTEPPPYFTHIDRLLKEERWKEIIQLGHEALALYDLKPAAKADIHITLAHCHSYLGNHELMRDEAEACGSLSIDNNDVNYLIHSLYLLSSYYRLIAQEVPKEREQQALFKEAEEYIWKAIQFSQNVQDPQLVGSIFFNAGALYADNPKGDPDQATFFYHKALACFKEAGSLDDIQRTLIRFAKVEMLQSRYAQAHKTLETIWPEIERKKTQVHYKFVEAQVFVAEQQCSLARKAIVEAISLAEHLEMKLDLKRLESLKRSVDLLVRG